MIHHRTTATDVDRRETEQAVRALSDADWYRLRQASRFLAWRAHDLDADALLAEAVVRTLDGRRVWRRDAVDFTGHLIGVMRSVAYHDRVAIGMTKVGTPSRLPQLRDVDPDDRLGAQQQIARVLSYFQERGDDEALRVLGAMKHGARGAEIRARLELSRRELETIMRRIRRGAHRVALAQGGLS